MTSLTVNGSSAAAATLAAAGKMLSATGGTTGNISTKVGTSTQFKQVFAKGTTTNQAGVASIPAPTDSNFSGWLWDVTTLEGQRIAAGTWTPTIHLLASTGTTVTPTVQWFKRSSAGVYTSIGSVAGSSIALTTSSQLLVFTAPSLSLMDFATGDKLCCWLWVNQTAGGATNSTISVVEDTVGTLGVASEAQTVTPGYAPTPVAALTSTLAGRGTITGTCVIPVGPTGAWLIAWNDEFDDTAGMSGPTNGLAASRWNSGAWDGPISLGTGNTTAVTDPATTSGVINYNGPASIVFPGDGAVHLRMQAGVDNSGTFNTRTVEGAQITTAGLMVLNPGSVPVSSVSPDLRPYTINGTLVLEVRARLPGPNASAGAYWPGIWTLNAGQYFSGSPAGSVWPGGNYGVSGLGAEIDLVELFSGGALGSESAVNFHGASVYNAGAGSGIPTALQTTDLSLAYHTYTYQFTTTTLSIWVDGILVTNVTPTTAQISAQWADPKYLLLDFQAKTGAVYPTTAASTPSDFMIDYVRVWTSISTVLTATLAGVGTAVLDPYGAELYGVRLYGTETLTLTTALVVTMPGVGALSGTLSTTGGNVSLGVTMPGVGTLAATLSAHTALTDTLAGVGTIAGTLSLATALAGTLAGVGTLSGTLSLNTALATTLTGVGTSACTLSAQAALTSTLAGVGTLTGAISERTALSATLPGVGTLTAALSGAGVLAVTIAGVGTLAGTAALATALAVTEAGAGTLSGTLTARTALAVTIAGTGTTSGGMAVATGLTVALAGVGTLAGTLAMQTALSVTEAAAGALAGTLSLRVALFLTCAGAGTCTPSLVILGGIACTMPGVGACVGAISFPGPSATATWVTRDLRATWGSRDLAATWTTRDLKTTWED